MTARRHTRQLDALERRARHHYEARQRERERLGRLAPTRRPKRDRTLAIGTTEPWPPAGDPCADPTPEPTR